MRHQIATVDDRHDLRDRKTSPNGEKESNPLHMCFVDLAKAYNPIYGTLLKTVLAWFGVLPKMLADIRHFHDGMRTPTWTDGGESSNWVGVEQGLH